ncbi:glycosyltransferase family 61 protein [Methylocystis sp. WRRC1]|uniref:glycosyltransferase family 61 protein n=1 Tax=Methylocystis sp. WRRC1 TaxID=1732014 RepID=UPI001D134B07|nr:glycosyltransferase 61 family protein [Methylocystis sp. WRRC1]MCC3243940.1 glycosyltransferase family 61 protein [Methylocystis sp. WRRC1]
MSLSSLQKAFAGLRRRRTIVQPPSPAAVATHIRQIVEKPAADADLGSFALSAKDVDTVLDHVSRVRAALALNLLFLRAKGDIRALASLQAFIREAFDRPDGVVDFERLMEDVEASLRRRAVSAITARNPVLARAVNRMIGVPELFAEMKRVMDGAFGCTELATRESFDEQAYLAANPDVAAAVANGEIRSGRAHFLKHGEREGRVQWRSDPDPSESGMDLIYPIALCRHDASGCGVGSLLEGAPVNRDALLSAPLDGTFSISVVADRESHDASPSFIREISIGADLAKFRDLLESLAWTAPPIYLAAFRDACADIENGVVMFDGGNAWGDSCFTTILSPGGRRRAADIFPLAGRYARVRRAGEEVVLHADVPLMLCTSWASRCNYGHWLMNSLLSVYLVLDELKAGRLKLLCPPLTDRQRAEILALGAPAACIVESGARYVRSERLIYPSPLATFANMAPSGLSVDFLKLLKERVPPAEEGSGPERLFLSRMGFPSSRRMSNEEELAAALEKIGVRTVFTHRMTLGEQIRLMSGAKLVVGQFGAALWNAPFLPPGAHVVEIATSSYASNEYLYISHLCGLKFSRVMIESSLPERNARAGKDFDFEAPVDKIAALVRSLI